MPTDDFETIYTSPGTRKLLSDLKKKDQASAISEGNIELAIALYEKSGFAKVLGLPEGFYKTWAKMSKPV